MGDYNHYLCCISEISISLGLGLGFREGEM